MLYWLSNPIWLGGSLTITTVATFSDVFTPLSGAGKYLFALAFMWFAVWAAMRVVPWTRHGHRHRRPRGGRQVDSRPRRR